MPHGLLLFPWEPLFGPRLPSGQTPGLSQPQALVVLCFPWKCLLPSCCWNAWEMPLPMGSIYPVIKRLPFKDTCNDPKCCQKENDIVGTPEALRGGPSAQCLAWWSAHNKGCTHPRTWRRGLGVLQRLIKDNTLCKGQPKGSWRGSGAQRGTSESDSASSGRVSLKQPPERRGKDSYWAWCLEQGEALSSLCPLCFSFISHHPISTTSTESAFMLAC